jgi:hypothetical protein
MPGVVGRLAAGEGSRMLGNDASVLADYDRQCVGIGPLKTTRRTRLLASLTACSEKSSPTASAPRSNAPAANMPGPQQTSNSRVALGYMCRIEHRLHRPACQRQKARS